MPQIRGYTQYTSANSTDAYVFDRSGAGTGYIVFNDLAASIAASTSFSGNFAKVDFSNVANSTLLGLPISTATQTALNAKLNSNSPTLINWATPAEFGAVGDNSTYDTVAFQNMFASGRPIWLKKPLAAYRINGTIPVPANTIVYADAGVIITYSNSGGLFSINGSNVQFLSGLDIRCESATKAPANSPVFLFNTASGAIIDGFRCYNFVTRWTGGIAADNGGTGALQNTLFAYMVNYVQRGIAFNFTRNYASFFIFRCYTDYGSRAGYTAFETAAESNYPYYQGVCPSGLSGVGGYYFIESTFGGVYPAYPTNTLNVGFKLDDGSIAYGGYRLHGFDIDACVGKGFVGVNLQNCEFQFCKFASMHDVSIDLSGCTDFNGCGNRFNYVDTGSVAAINLKANNQRIIIGIDEADGYKLGAVEINGVLGNSQTIINSNGDGLWADSQVWAENFFQTAFTANDPGRGLSPYPEAQLRNNMFASSGNAGAGSCSVGTVNFGGATQIDGNLYGRRVLRFNQTNTSATNPYIDLEIKPIEDMGNQWITLNFYARNATGGNITVIPQIVQRFGTGGSPSGDVTYSGPNLTVTSSFSRYVVQIQAPSLAGKTFGTSGDGVLRVRLLLPSATVMQFDLAYLEVKTGQSLTPLPLPAPNGFVYA